MPIAVMRDAQRLGTQTGRGGKGTVYLWAAGNGRQSNDNVNYDSMGNSRFVIAVGSLDQRGSFARYSEPGAAMLVTAPGGDLPGNARTIDRVGDQGYNRSAASVGAGPNVPPQGAAGQPADLDCTNSFNGTSNSTPLASGAVALMLQANANLTWRDVMHILVRTAFKTDPTEPGWTTNGAGRPINHNYGFGRVDAAAATTTAASWVNVAAQRSFDSGPITPANRVVAPGSTTTVNTYTVPVGQGMSLEHVEVTFSAQVDNRGWLQVELVSPAGTRSRLASARTQDTGRDYNNWVFMTVHSWDEASAGTWRLEVTATTALSAAELGAWRLTFHGTGAPQSSAVPAVFRTVQPGW